MVGAGVGKRLGDGVGKIDGSGVGLGEGAVGAAVGSTVGALLDVVAVAMTEKKPFPPFFPIAPPRPTPLT